MKLRLATLMAPTKMADMDIGPDKDESKFYHEICMKKRKRRIRKKANRDEQCNRKYIMLNATHLDIVTGEENTKISEQKTHMFC